VIDQGSTFSLTFGLVENSDIMGGVQKELNPQQYWAGEMTNLTKSKLEID